MEWLIISLIMLLTYELRNQWPAKSLYYINSLELSEYARSGRYKLIDIREAPDYYENKCSSIIYLYMYRGC